VEEALKGKDLRDLEAGT